MRHGKLRLSAVAIFPLIANSQESWNRSKFLPKEFFELNSDFYFCPFVPVLKQNSWRCFRNYEQSFKIVYELPLLKPFVIVDAKFLILILCKMVEIIPFGESFTNIFIDVSAYLLSCERKMIEENSK